MPKGSMPAFKQYIRAHFFYCQREFPSIYIKMYTISGLPRCTWDLRSCTLRWVI